MFETMLANLGFESFIRKTVDACEELANKKGGNWGNCASNLQDFIGNMPSENDNDHVNNMFYDDYD